jgi:hypothetical protein
MTLATPQLVMVLQSAPGLFYVIAGPGICLVVLVVGGVWGFRLGGQGGRDGGGGTKRPPRRQPTPPGGRQLGADFVAWEDQLRATGKRGPADRPDDAEHREDRPLRVG